MWADTEYTGYGMMCCVLCVKLVWDVELYNVFFVLLVWTEREYVGYGMMYCVFVFS